MRHTARPARTSTCGPDYADKLAHAAGAGFDTYTATLYARGSFRLSSWQGSWPRPPWKAKATTNGKPKPHPSSQDL